MPRVRTPEQIERQKARSRRLYQADPDKMKRHTAAHPEMGIERKRRYRRRHKDRLAAAERAHRAANLDAVRAQERARWANNPGIYRAKTARRNAARLQAMPSWVDRAAIDDVYRLAAVLDMTVDHIHPLHGPNFCGLHVPWNLQLLSRRDNSSKSNRLDFTPKDVAISV